MPHPQSWNNPWHGRADGASVRRILEDGCLGLRVGFIALAS